MDAMRELVLPRLEGVRKSGGGFMARCPAHDDGKASLSVSPGRDQPVVLHCHANCDPEAILGKLGLTWADLTNPKPRADDGTWTPAGPAVAVYSYRDEAGQLLFDVCRTVNKEFRQRVPDPTAKGGYRWRLGDVRRVPYHLPQLIEAVKDDREIWICEGEKDVHTLESLGQAATCNPGGAGKWREEYAEFFRDASVLIVADKDEPGRAHARQVAAALGQFARELVIVEAADGCKDVTDHVGAGHPLAEMPTTWSSAEPDKVELAQDLWEFLATPDEEYDWLVPGLLERGDRLILTGFEGLGKSMLVRQLAVAIAAGLHPFSRNTRMDPKKVLLIDCENTPRQSRRRFRPLAATSEHLHSKVPDGGLRLIHRPAGLDLTRAEDAAWLTERVTAHRPDALFIGPFYRLHNANINEELPARKVVALLDRLREIASCALVIEAHAGHGEHGKNRSVRPAGSSLLMRWPEFGYGITPADETGRTVELKKWRGPRDEREWPDFLTWGNWWPWEISPNPSDLKGRP